MNAEMKTGTTDTIVSSYSLFFSNGLRLKTDPLTFVAKDYREQVRQQFLEVVEALRAAGIVVTGELR